MSETSSLPVTNLDIKEVCKSFNSLKTIDKVPIKKIFIANVDPDTPQSSLVGTFSQFGQVVKCVLKKQKQKKNQIRLVDEEQDLVEIRNEIVIMKSYAFITYRSAKEAHKAIIAGIRGEINVRNQNLRVVPANSWNQPDNQDYYNQQQVLEVHQDDHDTKLSKYTFYICEKGSLNNDCLSHIFNYLPFFDRVRVERVSRRWQEVSIQAWYDQHSLNFDPTNWGKKSLDQMDLIDVDACSVCRMLQKCGPFLTRIDLSKFTSQLGNSTLIKLADMCPNLESINLDNFDIEHSGVRALASKCLKLKRITLGYIRRKYKFDSELSFLFSRNHKLEKLEIDCFIIEGDCLHHLPKKCMQELILNNADYVVFNGFYKGLRKMVNLRVLKISGIPGIFREYHDFIKCIFSCLKLEVLEIPSKPTHNVDSSQQFIWNNLKPLPKLANLTKINLKGNCAVNDDFLIHLAAKCQNLTYVDVSDCPEIKNRGLTRITNLSKLEFLGMDRLTNITCAIFSKPMSNLKTLLCSGCTQLDKLGMCAMVTLAERLEKLDLTNCTCFDQDFVQEVRSTCPRTILRSFKLYVSGLNKAYRVVTVLND